MKLYKEKTIIITQENKAIHT